MDTQHPTPTDPLDAARGKLAAPKGQLFQILKQLQAIRTAAQDPRGESYPLLIARLDEAAARLRELVDDGRQTIATAAEEPED